MPANTPPQNDDAPTPAGGDSDQVVRQRRSREDMNEARRELNERARTAAEKRRKRDEAREDLENLARRNEQFAEANSSSLLGYLIAAAVPAAVWVIDVVLLNRAAQYLIGSGNHLPGPLVKYGIYFITTAVVVIEMFLSRQREAAKREATRHGEFARDEDRKRYKNLKIFSFMMAGAIPLMAVFALLAGEYAGTGVSGMTLKMWGPVVGLAFIAVVAHGAVVYAGPWIHNARGYLFYRLRRRRRRRRVRRAEDAYERACAQVADQLDTYREAHARCDREHPGEEIELGPFGVNVRTAVNAHHGYAYMAVPDAPGDGDDAPDAPSPTPVPDNPEDPSTPGGNGAPPPAERSDLPSGDGAMQPELPAATPPPAEPSAASADDPADDPGESQAMADYYRNLHEAQRRDADGEISL